MGKWIKEQLAAILFLVSLVLLGYAIIKVAAVAVGLSPMPQVFLSEETDSGETDSGKGETDAP